MPRKPRVLEPNRVYHAYNRRTDRQRLFPSPRSYDEFVDLLEAGVHRYGVRVCSYCALETHWHQAIWVRQDDGAAAVSKYLRWLSSCHALRFRFTTETRGQGHVYQDRYKARPVQDDAHYLTLVRYIEANPVVAGLVERAEQWPWSSFAERMSGRRRILDDGPVRLPEDWSDIVNASVELELPDFMAPQTTERRRRRRSRWSGTEVLRPGTEVAR
jgi:putative transposase